MQPHPTDTSHGVDFEQLLPVQPPGEGGDGGLSTCPRRRSELVVGSEQRPQRLRP